MADAWIKGLIPVRCGRTVTSFDKNTSRWEEDTFSVNGLVFGFFGIHRNIISVGDDAVPVLGRSHYVITHLPTGRVAGAHRSKYELQRYAEMAMADPILVKQLSSKSVRKVNKALRPVMEKWRQSLNEE